MRPGLSFAIALAFAAALPGRAIAGPAEHSAPAAADKIEQGMLKYYEQLGNKQYKQAYETAGAIQFDRSNNAARGVIVSMQAVALFGMKRENDAMAQVAWLDSQTAVEPYPYLLLFIGALQIERTDVAANAFDKLIARAPDVVRDLDQELVGPFLRSLPKGKERDDRSIALARIGFGINHNNGQWFTASAIDTLIERGDLASAGELLGNIDDPRIFERLLILKRYSALWPMVERRAGPHFEAVNAAAVARTEQNYREDPDNHDLLGAYATALFFTGRFDDAVALEAKLPQGRQAMGAADQDMGWAVNAVAYALHEAGKHDEADHLFKTLSDAPVKDGGWRVSMMINRLGFLLGDGRFAEVAALLPATREITNSYGSAYAKQLVRQIEYCTDARLGRAAEAAVLRTELLAHVKATYGATADALICAGEFDAAEKVILEGLASGKRDHEEALVRGLQTRFLSTEIWSVWGNDWHQMRERPAIAAAFDKIGRDLPPTLFRTPRAQ